MRKIVVLSSGKDPDLYALYRTVGSREFSKLARDSLRATVRPNYRSQVELPEKMDTDFLPGTVELQLYFSEEKDPDVVNLLEHCRSKKAPAFIRHAIRLHVGAAYVLPSYLNSDFVGAFANPQAVRLVMLPAEGGSLAGKKPPKKKSTAKKERKPKIAVKVKKESPVSDAPVSKEPSFGPLPICEKEADTVEIKVKNPADEEAEMLALLDGLLG